MSKFEFSISDIAAFFGTGSKTPYSWFKVGCPGRLGRGKADLKQIYDWRREKEQAERSDQDLEESKRRYWQAKAEREKLAAERERGQLVDFERVIDEWTARTLEFKSAMFLFENALPPLLEGKSQREMAGLIYRELWKLFDRMFRAGTFTPATGISYQTPMPKHRTILKTPKLEDGNHE